jgi:hypothetical protein
MGGWMSNPIPFWRDDIDYFPPRDERRERHVAEIKRRRRSENAIDAAVADGSYLVVVRRVKE